ncbi:MAG TPA: hypothetical protein PLE99_00715 [Candidatus Thiothrix moscowensis]|uniref:hypothetical protein n=1 Tax=unclassified Thiothrix TaxID=2636184 RepID=UPI0025EFA81E|nr:MULTISPECIES: hypothetical protein [unclassified Thiothrix]HRJ51257.1 hypothetical protein [Candidatus Thiothrix moscowensis]HRJ91688.1 hypothetical protein [Candidatus Thiothrix moscowensis]
MEQQKQNQRIAYWADGFHLSEESARLCVDVGAFSADYQIAEFPADADPALIDSEIAALLVQQAGQAST